ncbi:MAG: sugar phosphate isomerase/epimerase, partial [Flavobacterium sp.]
MDINYLCPHWGSECQNAATFLETVLPDRYNGVEINMPENKTFITDFMGALNMIRQQREFIFVAQSVPDSVAKETVTQHIQRVQKRLRDLVALEPDFINSHTGKDFFSFDDNCRVIEAIEELAEKSGVAIVHETHRGRFSFHAPAMTGYLERFPQMKLAADYSHWCNVSESLLEGQEELLEKMLPNITHLHARVGQEQAPQVSDPFAPEWQRHLDIFTGWWKQIIEYQKAIGTKSFTITPEFGPYPYMPVLPFTQQPVG